MEMPDSINLKKYLSLALQLFIFVMIPVLIVIVGLGHIQGLGFNNRLRSIEKMVEIDLSMLEESSRTESFLARSFYRQFIKAAAASHPEEIIGNFHQQLPQTFDYIIWNQEGKITSTTLDISKNFRQWKMAFKTIREPFVKHSRDLNFSEAELINIRTLLGPQILLEGIVSCQYESNEKLLWNDSTGRHPLAWIRFSEKFTMIALVPQEKLATRLGLENKIKTLVFRDYKAGFCSGKTLSNPEIIAAQDREEISNILQKHSILTPGKIETRNTIYFQRVIDDELSVFAALPVALIKQGTMISPMTGGLTLFILLLPIVLLLSIEPFTGHKPRFSLSKKLGLLFIYSNGLPLAILFFTGFDYITQKEHSLYGDIHARGISFLQNFDERLESEHALHILRIQRGLETLREELKICPINTVMLRELANRIKAKEDDSMRFYLIASDSTTFGNNDYLQISNQIFPINEEKFNEEERKKRTEEYRITKSLFSYILTSLNGNTVDQKSATEVELIAESTMQKSVIEVQHEFIAGKGRISTWGIGTKRNSAFIDFISLSESQKYDYLFMCSWSQGNLEEGYLKRQYLNANRNIEDIEICISDEKNSRTFPSESRREVELLQRMKTFTTKPNETGEFVRYRNYDHLLMGIRGKHLQEYNLAALYPVEAVKQQIYLEKKQLITAGIFSLLLAVSLGLLLSHSILFPLKLLTGGAKAIQQRNFAIRLPDLGRDEFGSIASLFNESMVDLEELKVAGTVQDRLFPKKLPDCGVMKICGRNMSIGDLGGDYYDYFNSSSGRLNLLIGDVEGQGTGAALIMAMAKAAIMQLENILDDPAAIMKRMNELILQSNKKKSMTFQYMSFDITTASAIYSNAGGLPPIVFNTTSGATKEICLPGSLLGTSSSQDFTNISFKLEPGEAMILYTDGIVENLTHNGHALGIEGLKEIIANNYHPDPAIFCDNLFAGFLAKIHPAKPTDDISLIIVTHPMADHSSHL